MNVLVIVVGCLVATSFCCNEIGCLQSPSERSINVTNDLHASFSKLYNSSVKLNNEHNFKFRFAYFGTLFSRFNPLETKIIVRVATKGADLKYPVLFLIAQNRGEVVPVQIPFKLGDDIAGQMNSNVKVLCISRDLWSDSALQIRVSTQSPVEVPFTLSAIAKPMRLSLGKKATTAISVGQPDYFYFTHDYSTTENVIIKVTTQDRICTILAIQEPKCPVFGEEHNVRFQGSWKTLFTKGAISVKRDTYKNGFYIKLIMTKHDSTCSDGAEINVSENNMDKLNVVSIVVDQDKLETEGNLFFAAIIPSSLSLLVAVIVGLIYLCVYKHTSKDFIHNLRTLEGWEVSISGIVEETDEDWGRDHIAPNVSTRYFFKMMISISILFSVPVFSLIIFDVAVMSETGNLDMCYYNDFCSHSVMLPQGLLRDFNHIVSNCPFIILGMSFLFIAWKKNKLCRTLYASDVRKGIQIHFGLYYAMGVALIMEGVMSAAYHLCPNKSNFQYAPMYFYIPDVSA